MTNYDQLLAKVSFNGDGLVPCIAQCQQTGRVLMMAWMNRESLAKTIEKGEAVYWSRSRQRLWHKGEQSGHTQTVHALQLDCDGDTLLLQVEQHGNIACHTGRNSCFYLAPNENLDGWESTEEPLKDSGDIYSN